MAPIVVEWELLDKNFICRENKISWILSNLAIKKNHLHYILLKIVLI